MKRMTKRVVSLALAFMLIFGMIGVTPISLAETKETKYELLNPDVRTDLEEAEIALAFDLNADFNFGEFAIIKDQSGLNSFKISVKEFVSKTNSRRGERSTPVVESHVLP